MKSALIILFCFMGLVVNGQVVALRVDTNQLRIGEQTIMHLSFTYSNPKSDALIIWPDYETNLTDGIEIVEKSVDRERLIDSASATYIREQQLRITAFEEGVYTIPAQEIRLGDSLYYSNTAVLQVSTVEVDTSKGIADIKPIYDVNYPFSERSKDWLKENWPWLAAIAALILAFLLWRYYKKRKPISEVEVLEEVIPAHIIALETLQKLLKEERWKSSEKKLYYSELTDTVRTYLENRFDIHAMEQTTREIITELKHAAISDEDKTYLQQILREADLVKFAKFNPSDDQAFAYLNKSIDFVKRTKEKEPKNNDN